MTDALNYIYYIINKCINLVFNDMTITSNVSIGWIAISVIVFSMLISSILNLPRGMGKFDKFRQHKYVSVTKHGDGSTTWSERKVFRR